MPWWWVWQDSVPAIGLTSCDQTSAGLDDTPPESEVAERDDIHVAVAMELTALVRVSMCASGSQPRALKKPCTSTLISHNGEMAVSCGSSMPRVRRFSGGCRTVVRVHDRACCPCEPWCR